MISLTRTYCCMTAASVEGAKACHRLGHVGYPQDAQQGEDLSRPASGRWEQSSTSQARLQITSPGSALGRCSLPYLKPPLFQALHCCRPLATLQHDVSAFLPQLSSRECHHQPALVLNTFLLSVRLTSQGSRAYQALGGAWACQPQQCQAKPPSPGLSARMPRAADLPPPLQSRRVCVHLGSKPKEKGLQRSARPGGGAAHWVLSLSEACDRPADRPARQSPIVQHLHTSSCVLGVFKES